MAITFHWLVLSATNSVSYLQNMSQTLVLTYIILDQLLDYNGIPCQELGATESPNHETISYNLDDT